MKLHDLTIFESDRLEALKNKGIRNMSKHEVSEYELLCKKAISYLTFRKSA